MTTPSDLSIVLLYVSDLNASLAYYTEVIGLHHVPEADTPVFRGFGRDPEHITFGICQPFDETRQVGQAEVYFSTENLGRLREAISGQGVHTTPITQQYYGSIFTVDSLDGHLVTMVSNSPA